MDLVRLESMVKSGWNEWQKNKHISLPVPSGIQASFESPLYGRHEHVIVTIEDSHGAEKFGYDAVVVTSQEATTVIAYGMDENGALFLGVFAEVRPLARDSKQREEWPKKGLEFLYVPGGLTRDIEEALDELFEELNIVREAVLSIVQPLHSYYYADPAIIGTPVRLLFVQVDLQKLRRVPPQEICRAEQQNRTEFIAVREYVRRIAAGETDGVLARAGNVNNAVFVFLAHCIQTSPEFVLQLSPNWDGGPLTYEF